MGRKYSRPRYKWSLKCLSPKKKEGRKEKGEKKARKEGRQKERRREKEEKRR